MTSLGPFSLQTVAVVLALLVAWRVPGWVTRGDMPRRQAAASVVLDAILVGLIAARLSYILRWWPDYLAAPFSMIAIADGGFHPWSGLVAALAFAFWRTRARLPLRLPALAGIAAGMAAWLVVHGVLALLQGSAPPLPDLALTTLDERPASPLDHAGRPVVMNLWATWCPPCRREMPALARAANHYPGVSFLMVNQGESAKEVGGYLIREDLHFDHVLLDPNSRASQSAGARGLPTTLFFDARGRLVDTHMGELTGARLNDILQNRFNQKPAARTAQE